MAIFRNSIWGQSYIYIYIYVNSTFPYSNTLPSSTVPHLAVMHLMPSNLLGINHIHHGEDDDGKSCLAERHCHPNKTWTISPVHLVWGKFRRTTQGYSNHHSLMKILDGQTEKRWWTCILGHYQAWNAPQIRKHKKSACWLLALKKIQSGSISKPFQRSLPFPQKWHRQLPFRLHVQLEVHVDPGQGHVLDRSAGWVPHAHHPSWRVRKKTRWNGPPDPSSYHFWPLFEQGEMGPQGNCWCYNPTYWVISPHFAHLAEVGVAKNFHPPPGGSPNLKYFITALQFLELIRLDKWRRVESRICLKTRWAPKSSDTWGEK